MTLTNSQMTERVEELTENLKGKPASIINQIKTMMSEHNAHDNASPSLSELNRVYKEITSSQENLINPQANYTPQDEQQVADIAMIQLQAIVNGFKAVESSYAIPVSTPSYVQRSTSTEQANIQRVEVHHYNHRQDNFWRDLMIWDMIFGSHHNRYGNPPPPSSRKKDKEGDVGVAGVLFACLLVAGALATIGYTAVQTYKRIEEIVHNEDKVANTAKITVTALAAWQGYMLGALLGAACFSNPILGGICAACIISAGAMKLSKWGAELYHQQNNTTSALGYDPRFCLNASEIEAYAKYGLNADIANEALRECAITIKNDPTNGLVFWENPHREIIELMRNIKTGSVANKLVINGKEFDLKSITHKSFSEGTFFEMEDENVSQAHQAQGEIPVVIATEIKAGMKDSEEQTPMASLI